MAQKARKADGKCYCSLCAAELEPDAVQCEQCYSFIEGEFDAIECVSCGGMMPMTIKVCRMCGTALPIDEAALAAASKPSAPKDGKTIEKVLSQDGSLICASCGAGTVKAAIKCMGCNADFTRGKVLYKCPACGKLLDDSQKTCSFCGASLEELRQLWTPQKTKKIKKVKSVVKDSAGTDTDGPPQIGRAHV